jgi:hypothetical protein
MTSLGVQYIPVSLVWHKDVSDAHHSKHTTDEAVALTWFVPIRILNSAKRSLRGTFRQLEIWHDYLSVPQWNYDVQQRLLLYLPSICKSARYCVSKELDVEGRLLFCILLQMSNRRGQTDNSPRIK